MQEMQVRLAQEDLLEKEMLGQQIAPAWEIAETEGPGGLQPIGL